MAYVAACNDGQTGLRGRNRHDGTDRRGVDIAAGPDTIRAHFTIPQWRRFRADVKAGEYDDVYPETIP